MNWPVVVFDNLQSFDAIPGLQHCVAALAKKLPHEFSKVVLIFRKQDRFCSMNGSVGILRRLSWLDRFVHARQVDFKRRPKAGFAIYPNESAPLLDDSIDCCQPEARPFSLFLGC